MPTLTNEIFDALVAHIAPLMFRERADCWSDPDWDGQPYWLNADGVDWELAIQTEDEALAEAWDVLPWDVQRGALEDALDVFITTTADIASASY
jgi:hypothetical protein